MKSSGKSSTADSELISSLKVFSDWLEAFAPRHRALRTPVYLEPEAPEAMRALWDATGFSDAMVAGVSTAETRPERCFADASANQVIKRWFSDPRVRESWGVASPKEATEAVREKLPRKTRFIAMDDRTLTFTDETTGSADPPVLEMDETGQPRPWWPSYVRMVLWQASKNVSSLRSSRIEGAPPGSAGEHGRPFAPALPGFWTLHEGVWGIGPNEAFENGAAPAPPSRWSTVYTTPAHYFRYVWLLPDGDLDLHFPNRYGMHYLAVNDGKRLDPEDPSVPTSRISTRPCGADGKGILYHGLVEVDGLRLWVEKQAGARATAILAEPEQLPDVRAFLKREEMQVYEQLKPKKDRFLVAPTAAELAAARKLHDKARAAAEEK